tara:strand:+ start:6182 stop:7831 length:1650 start_codon:yes stop_codon:yes gene_type:complete
MALSINLNTCTTVDAKHTVSIAAGGGVTANTTTTGFKTITNYVLTPNSGVEVTIATVTFTPSTSCYYVKEPTYKLKATNKSAYNITETVVKDSENRVTSKVFLIKYTNTINSFGDLILFSHETQDLPVTTNVYNNALVEITSFELETSDIASGGGIKSFTVNGDAASRFNLKVTRSSDSKTYDFSSTTFTTPVTQLSDKLIGSTGSFTSSITFPKITADDVYTVELSPVVSKGTTLNSVIQDSTDDLKSTLTINQYKAITISLTSISSANNSSYSGSPKYATITFVGERNSSVRLQKSISFDFALSADSFTFARGYTTNVGGMAELDFRSSVVKVKNGNQAAGTVVALDDVNNLVEGMTLTGTGVTGTPRVLSINTENKTVTVSVAQDAQGDGGIADDANLTFSYGGSSTSKAISGCEFELLGLDEVSTGFLLNAATLTPVTTLVNGDFTGGSASATITLDSTAGIKAGSTTTVSGKGLDAAAAVPTVSSVTNGTVLVLSASQDLADNTPLTFTGSSRSANLTFDFAITNFGTVDHTITINLDSILTVS